MDKDKFCFINEDSCDEFLSVDWSNGFGVIKGTDDFSEEDFMCQIPLLPLEDGNTKNSTHVYLRLDFNFKLLNSKEYITINANN